MLSIVRVYSCINFKLTMKQEEFCLFGTERMLDVFCSENDHLETYSIFL